MNPVVTKSRGKLVRARFNKGMPLTMLERMRFEEMSEKDKERMEKPWGEVRAGLNSTSILLLGECCGLSRVDIFLYFFCQLRGEQDEVIPGSNRIIG